MTGHISNSTGLPPTQSTSVNQPAESGQNSTGHVANRSVAVSHDSPKPPAAPRGIGPDAQPKPNAATSPSVPVSDADAFVNDILHSAEQAGEVIDAALLNDILQYATGGVAAQPKPNAAMGPSVPASDTDTFVNDILQGAEQAGEIIDAALLNDILQDATRAAAQPKPDAAMGPSVPVSDMDAFVNDILQHAEQAGEGIDAALLNEILQDATRVGQALPQDESEAPRGKPISEDLNKPIYFGIENENDEPAPSTQP